MTQYRQNKPFHCNQKSLYEELGGKRRKTSGPPQTDDAGKSWSELWDKAVQYMEDVERLVIVAREMEVLKIQNNVVTTKKDVIKQVYKMLNWLDYI